MDDLAALADRFEDALVEVMCRKEEIDGVVRHPAAEMAKRLVQMVPEWEADSSAGWRP